MSGPTKPARWHTEREANGRTCSILSQDGRHPRRSVIAWSLDPDDAFRIVECVNGCNDEAIDDPEAWIPYAKECVRVVELAPGGGDDPCVDAAEKIIRAYVDRGKLSPAATLKSTLEIADAAARMDADAVRDLTLTATRDQLRDVLAILVSHQAILAPPPWLEEYMAFIRANDARIEELRERVVTLEGRQ